MKCSYHFGTQLFLNQGEKHFQRQAGDNKGYKDFGARQMSISLNNFRTILEFNKSSVSAHVGVSWWKSNVCIAYEPLGPTIKSWDGVRVGELN